MSIICLIKRSIRTGVCVGLSFWSVCATSAQAPYIEIMKPLDRTLTLGFDRTASDSHDDIAQGLAKNPSLYFPAFFEGVRSSGLFAGGRVKIQVFSYQMWLLDHPNVQRRKEIPSNTQNNSGQLEIQFFNKGQLISKKIAIAKNNRGNFKLSYCSWCNDHRNPAYSLLETDPIEIPLSASDVVVVLVGTTDLSTDKQITQTSLSGKQSVFYHADPNPFHIRGKDTKPKDVTIPQFSIMEGFQIKSGASFQFEAEFWYGRTPSMIWSDQAVTQSYQTVAVCYDELHPKRIHYVNGNDIKTFLKLLFYRVDKGKWNRIDQTDSVFNVPEVHGKRFEFAFEYDLYIDLKHGLHDINRCYQVGSDFKWLPSHPGIEKINLGKFYDSPTGNLTHGWIVKLD